VNVFFYIHTRVCDHIHLSVSVSVCVCGRGERRRGGRAISGISSDQSVPVVGGENPQLWRCYGLLQVPFAKVE